MENKNKKLERKVKPGILVSCSPDQDLSDPEYLIPVGMCVGLITNYNQLRAKFKPQ